MPQSIHSDERLVERASSGDRRALASIYKRYHQDLFRYCAALLGNAEDAGDALQNTMVKVLSALPGERRRVHLKPWLYRIAHNESIELLRRRRDFDPIEPEALVGAQGPESSAETRERLRQLIADLRELPERQRGGLVMRELGGLSFEQIGSAFETSAAVARQTVYEARLGLQEMERGRAMACDEVRRKLSDGDRRVFRRRDVRAHLRQCRDCREFERAISCRRGDLAAISPLPALAAAGLLKGVLGGAAAGSAGGTAAGAGSIGGAISASAAAKTVATVVVAGVIGVSAADRTGLVHVFHGSGGAGGPASSGDGGSAGEGSAGGGGAAAQPPGGDEANRARGGSEATSSPAEHKPAVPKKGSAGESPGAPIQGAGAGSDRSEPAAPGKSFGHGHAKVTGKSAEPANAHGANPHAKGESHGKAVGHGHRGGGSGKGERYGHAKAPHIQSPVPQGEPNRPPEQSASPASPQSQPDGEAEAGQAAARGEP